MGKLHRLLATVVAALVQRVRSASVQERPTRRTGSVQFSTAFISRAKLLMPTTFRAFAGIIVSLAVAGANAKAEDVYPSKPVRIVVSFAAGGPTDTVARVTGAKLGELLGQQFVVENKAGAGGNIGADMVAKASPDGYTLLMATVSTHAINPGLYKKMPYDPVRDFVALGRVGVTPTLLGVTNSRIGSYGIFL